ncbi:MAG: DNA cytosine methyltransferase [Clostridiales bacterium]|nr:DNA cytosine methyltransferase [Clostridiales bacterium]
MKGYQDNLLKGLIVDNFAGGGGASVGIELAVGRPVDIAINHDADAIAMHKVNHPYTTHYQEDVFAIDPVKVTGGRPVDIAWFSPDCKHFSKAKGGKPVEKKIRGLSWVILKWAMSSVAPTCIFMENVEEIQTWGPLVENNGKMYPDPKRKGETFKGFIAMLTKGINADHPAFAEACEFLHIDPSSEDGRKLANGLGYKVDCKVLKACDYDTPTLRKRFYLIARNDGQPIVFPKPTNGKGLKPYRTASECIDMTIPCPSIFGRKKELAINTQRRIARGLDKFVIKNPKPFIMQVNFENVPQDIDKPMSTQTAVNKHYLGIPKIEPYIMSNNTGNVPKSVSDSTPTVTTGNRNFLCEAFITKYFGGEKQSGADLNSSKPTVTGIDHNALVAVNLSSRHGDGKDGRGSKVDEPTPTHTATNHEHLIATNIVHYYGGEDHASKTDDKLPTITTLPRHYLVASHMVVLRNNMDCKSMKEPIPTITAHGGHLAQIAVYLEKIIDGSQDLGHWAEIRKLLNDYAGYNIADDEILIIEINGVQHFISDVGMRMLEPEELKLAQGCPKDYIIDIESHIGKPYSKAKQIARLGNMVCPPVATALVRANCPQLAYGRPLKTVAELESAMCV